MLFYNKSLYFILQINLYYKNTLYEIYACKSCQHKVSSNTRIFLKDVIKHIYHHWHDNIIVKSIMRRKYDVS